MSMMGKKFGKSILHKFWSIIDTGLLTALQPKLLESSRPFQWSESQLEP